MEKLNRIAIGNRIIMDLYNSYSKLGDQELSAQFYSFLKDSTERADLFTRNICFHYQIIPEKLSIYKKDSILEILAASYGYLKYLKTFCKISAVEEEILNDLDTLPFSISNLIEYFRKEENESKMNTLLLDYFVYVTQGNHFMESCREYLVDESTIFYDKLCRVICYIEVMDSLVNIYNEVFDIDFVEEEDIFSTLNDQYDDEQEETEYEDYDSNLLQEENEDEIEREALLEFQEREKQLAKQVLSLLENYYLAPSDRDEFVGYFMSFFYAFLLQEERQQTLIPEEEEILKQLNRKNMSFESVIKLFYSSKGCLLSILDLFAERYNDEDGDIFDAREEFTSLFYSKRFKIMDFFYEEPKVSTDINIVYYGKPISKVFDDILLEIREKKPTSYISFVWNLLRNPEFDHTIFEEHGLDLNYYTLYQQLMIKYLFRKYIEIASFSSIKNFHLEELVFYREIIDMEENMDTLLSLFDIGYTGVISGYYYMIEKGKNYEKDILHQFKENPKFSKLLQLDFSCTMDSTYRKALNESDFYRRLEKNGAPKTREYLEHLFEQNLSEGIEYLKELLGSNYYYAKREESLDDISSYVINSMEGEEDFGVCLQELLVNKSLLEELLQRYLDNEKKDCYSLSYQEKLDSSPKVKQKLYFND